MKREEELLGEKMTIEERLTREMQERERSLKEELREAHKELAKYKQLFASQANEYLYVIYYSSKIIL